MARKKSEKLLTPAQEMKWLRERIQAVRDAAKARMRLELTPLVKRLAVLEAKRRLDRAERALVKSVMQDHGDPQLELLGQDAAAPVAQADGDPGNPSADGPLFGTDATRGR